ncbi:MAG: alpha/beta hydrolase [Planctomycetes bacterium]|nr:alpha/beta hydrolase [Planctomycetota bacterium]
MKTSFERPLNRPRVLLPLFLLGFVSITSIADGSDVTLDIPYATVNGHVLKLDLHLPAGKERPKLIVWVHGGAWRAGSKKDMPLGKLLEAGYAVASVDYRLSPQAPFPAQVHDIKGAIRFLRAKRTDYGFDSERIVIAGASAGGHLAALVGVTNGHHELEGNVGEHLDQSSDVQAIVSFYGMSNLTTILSQSTPHGLKVRVPALQLLLEGQPEEKPELARLASPVFHVDASDPPLLLIHGDQDPQAPINQSHELQGRYESVNRPCEFRVVHEGKHGGAEFFDDRRLELVKRFLAANEN